MPRHLRERIGAPTWGLGGNPGLWPRPTPARPTLARKSPFPAARPLINRWQGGVLQGRGQLEGLGQLEGVCRRERARWRGCGSGRKEGREPADRGPRTAWRKLMLAAPREVWIG
ncbi:hypothetical protein GCM10010471_16140 [Leucobacter komagatae]